MNLIVFDIDDTLTKSEYQHQLAYVTAMREFGIARVDQNWKTYKHHTDSYILKANFENNHTTKFEFSQIPAFEERMTEHMLTLTEVSEIKGAKTVVSNFLDRDDYAVAFATGSLLKPALIKLNQSQIQYNPNLVVGSNTIYSREDIVKEAIKSCLLYTSPSPRDS